MRKDPRRNRSDGEKGIVYQLPILVSDLEALQALLMRENRFVPSFFARDEDLYGVSTYKIQELWFGKRFSLLIDRNVITRWIGLMNGATATPQHRSAAAVIAFAQCANILIEPCIALHELAAFAGNTAANEELKQFRIVDNSPLEYWVDVALGRTNTLRIPIEKVPVLPTPREQDLSYPLSRWRRNYIFVLKLAELHLRGGSSEHRMAEMLRWMYEDFFMGGPAVRLAVQYLAPGADRKGLLKWIESADREKAIAGLRNATWDLTLLSHFLEKIGEEQAKEREEMLWLLCSLDNHVLSFARSMVGDYGEADPGGYNHMRHTFCKLWGLDSGSRLAQSFSDYRRAADNPNRQLHRDVPNHFIADLIARGEDLIRNWDPR
jgi:hypothetical protein